MMKNVNQVCGVLALIAVGCLVAFGSAGDRIVSAAPGQIGQAGDTGAALAIGGCNRCAWNVKLIDVTLPFGAEYEIFPRGTTGAIGGGSFQFRFSADNFDSSATGIYIYPSNPGCGSVKLIGDNARGTKFIDGLTMTNNFTQDPYHINCAISYRLDSVDACNRCASNLKIIDTMVPAGAEFEIFPRGTSGTIQWSNGFSPVRADCFEKNAVGVLSPSMFNGVWNCDALYDNNSNGIRFIDGLVFPNNYDPPQDVQLRLSIYYRLD